MDSLGQGGPPGERPPNMLASIQSYLNRTQELMQNPTVLLPSLPDPSTTGLPCFARALNAVWGCQGRTRQGNLQETCRVVPI